MSRDMGLNLPLESVCTLPTLQWQCQWQWDHSPTPRPPQNGRNRNRVVEHGTTNNRKRGGRQKFKRVKVDSVKALGLQKAEGGIPFHLAIIVVIRHSSLLRGRSVANTMTTLESTAGSS